MLINIEEKIYKKISFVNFVAGEDKLKSGDTVVNLDMWRVENGSLYMYMFGWDCTK